MKKNNIFYKVGLLVVISLASCTDLDIEDKTALTPGIALDKVSAFQNLVYAAYSQVNDFGFYGQSAMLQADVLADNMDVVQFNGRYQGEMVNAVGSHFGRWGLYAMINDCNILLQRIDAPEVTGEQAAKDILKGEAYFLRALAYHELLRAYSYEPGQIVNGFDLGVVIRTEGIIGFAQVTDLPRSTVQDGYTLVKNDLTAAISLLPTQATAAADVNATGLTGWNNKFRATKAAAQALLARVYLYEGDYPNAATQADLALAATTAVLVDSAGYVDSWSTTIHPESIFESELRATDWSTVDGANNSLHSITMNVSAGAFFTLSPSEEFEDLVAEDGDDVRNNMIINSGDFRILRKWRAEKGAFLENLPIIRYSEVLLTAAEAKARSGNTGGAQTDITRFRAARVPMAVPVTVTGPALVDVIMRERRLELIAEGHRFYDLKRLGQTITKSTLAKSLGAVDLQYNNFKVLSRIPIAEVNISNALEQNPEY